MGIKHDPTLNIVQGMKKQGSLQSLNKEKIYKGHDFSSGDQKVCGKPMAIGRKQRQERGVGASAQRVEGQGLGEKITLLEARKKT